MTANLHCLHMAVAITVVVGSFLMREWITGVIVGV